MNLALLVSVCFDADFTMWPKGEEKDCTPYKTPGKAVL